MKSLTECPSATLAWRRGGFTPSVFELAADDGIFAILTFLDEDCILARVETAEGSWTFKHTGVLAPAVTLREEGGKTNLAVFHPHALRHGKLQFQDGAAFDWVWRHDLTMGGDFLDAEGKPLVRLHARQGRDLTSTPGLERCDVEVSLPASARQRHALLAAFGWYLIYFDHLKERDALAAETALRL